MPWRPEVLLSRSMVQYGTVRADAGRDIKDVNEVYFVTSRLHRKLEDTPRKGTVIDSAISSSNLIGAWNQPKHIPSIPQALSCKVSYIEPQLRHINEQPGSCGLT